MVFSSAHTHLRRRPLSVAAAAFVAALLTIVPAAQASSGRIVPQGFHQRPGAPLRVIPRLADGAPSHQLWDAQPSGALIANWDARLTLNATNATGKTVWSVAGRDIWTASGVLPAAFAAVYSTADPNAPGSGKLVAYRADGTLRFKRTFRNAFVVPLCDTAKRLEWVEVSSAPAMRLFVRQDGVTRTLRVPWWAKRARIPSPFACSRNGNALALGSIIQPGRNGYYAHRVYWVRVDASGIPRIVSDKRTNWVEVAVSPGGDWAATMPADGYPKTWVRFGQFTGRYLPGDDTSGVQVGPKLIFETGHASFGSSDNTTWGQDTVMVITRPRLYLGYERTWVNDGKGGGVWFTPDPDVQWALSPDAVPGSLTVINLLTWDMASVPSTYADAMLVKGGQIATLSDTGTLGYIPNPVPGP